MEDRKNQSRSASTQFNHNAEDDYYAILGLEFGACHEDIVSAYRRLARQFHPDKNVNNANKVEAEEKFRRIKLAYEVLSDENKRTVYNTFGAEGVKYMNWNVERRILNTEELMDEFKKFQTRLLESKINLYTRPFAVYTVGLDMSELFKKQTPRGEYDGDEDYDQDEEDEYFSLMDYFPEINRMSASIQVENQITDNHTISMSGNLDAKNGIGDGTFATTYGYQFSKNTLLFCNTIFGHRPVFSVGFKRALNDKTSLESQGYILLNQYDLIAGGEVTLAQVLRDNLTGKITYKDGSATSLKTSLIYINEKLMIEVVASYKLGLIHQKATLGVDYKLNRNIRMTVEMGASTDEGLSLSYGCQSRILDINIVGATMTMSVPSGVTLKLKFVRATQEFNFPIYLSDEITSGPLFYGTVMPLAAYFIIERCYVRYVKPKNLFSS